MSTLVKAQLLKHLSKFVKNLSADHLTLKLLQGTGDIENIELNEVLLGSTIGLPPWLRLTRVHCNRMSLRLHWTKLTSEPIQIALDVVNVIIEAIEPTSAATEQKEKKENSSPNSAVLNSLRMPYGFINKAVDGITLAINTIKVQFTAGTFFASLELSHVTLQSCLPDWSREIKHLKNTRIKNSVVKQVLLFKLARCNTLRLETSEMMPDSQMAFQQSKPRLTPFRVIINKLDVKIQFKRSLLDSSVLCTKLFVEIEDILSVLTDAQAQVGLRFINHLQRLSAGSSVELAARRAALARTLSGSMESSPSAVPSQTDPSNHAYHKAHAVFISHDFSEHSTHVRLARIDLHLVAERASSCSDKEALKQLDPILLEGAVRVSLENLAFHLYPAHVLGSGYKGWPRYQRLFRNPRDHLDSFTGCFEAVVYGSIDSCKLYVANLPHEHNPNQLCISICGARKWPAVYFDSSQVVSEKDLSILDSRNAIRVSRVHVDFHLPTLLYLIVMVEDARELFKISEDLDLSSASGRYTVVELCEIDLVYQPATPKPTMEPRDYADSYPDLEPIVALPRPVIFLSVTNIVGQLVQRPDGSQNVIRDEREIISETELYAFLHSFLLPDMSAADEFERFCSDCSSQIEAANDLWQWEFNCVFARTVTATDGDIPLLYVPKIHGFMPHNMASDKAFAMLKCDPVEGPLQLFAERAQFDELQEMLRVFQNFGSSVQKSTSILNGLAARLLIDPSSKLPGDQSSNVVFLAPLVSIRLLLPAVPPLIVPLTANAATQTGDTPIYTPLPSDDSVHSLDHQSPSRKNSQQLREAILQAQAEDEKPLLSDDRPITSGDINSESTLSLFSKMTTLAESSSRSTLNESGFPVNTSDDGSNIISSSSSNESIIDFVVVKPEEDLVEEGDETSQPAVPQNPLDPSCMNFGLHGGQQEVVSVQLVIEGTTLCLESSGSNEPSKLEFRFDRVSPINKPKVIPRRDVYFPLDLPILFDETSLKNRPRRQFKATITEVPGTEKDSPPRACVNFWLAPGDAIPLISMSAINALAHFLSPDAPITENSTEPPLINIYSPSNEVFTLKMDTPNVFDHCPQELIHFIPQPQVEDKLMLLELQRCPVLLSQDNFRVIVTPTSSSEEVTSLQAEIERLRAENEQLKSQLKSIEQQL